MIVLWGKTEDKVPNRHEVGGGLPPVLLDLLDDEDEPKIEVKKKVKKSDKIADRKVEEKKLEDLYKDVLTAYLVKLKSGNSVKEEINSMKVDMIDIKKDINNKFDEVLKLLKSRNS